MCVCGNFGLEEMGELLVKIMSSTILCLSYRCVAGTSISGCFGGYKSYYGMDTVCVPGGLQ